MSEQQLVSIAGISTGFIAALFLCIGGASMSARNIKNLCSTRWDFNGDLAISLAAQRAQYVTGALLLLISFALQSWGIQASSTALIALPQWLQSWHALALSVMTVSSAVGLAICIVIYKTSIQRVRQILSQSLK